MEPEGSEIVSAASSVYRRVYGKEPRIVATHGGLESSTIKSKYPGLAAVSVGPTIIGAHTPDERMSVESLVRTKDYVFELVRELSRANNGD
ncbi:MAG: M20/M25/M40 family metallo-hydrolase [Candidatus Methanomethylophilaceae archaeon]|nr:M20/M25/M40 family metallo-hydrolase [Candidatus Methanomethylophilaceae archaeon]